MITSIEIILNILSILSLFIIGVGALRLLKLDINLAAIPLGFTAFLGFLQLFGVWFVAFRLSKQMFSLVALFIFIILLLTGLYFFKKNPVKITLKKEHFVFGIFILALIVLSLLFSKTDADDSFYVSNIALYSVSERLNLYDGSFGNPALYTNPNYDFMVWESLLAVISNITKIPPVILAHEGIVPLLLIISGFSYLALGESLFSKDTKKSVCFFVFIGVFYLFEGFSPYTHGSFLLGRIWQGKSVYLHVLVPLLMVLIVNLWEKKRELAFSLVLVILAGAGLNPTALYILPMLCGILLICLSFMKKDIKFILSGIPAAVVTLCFLAGIFLRSQRFFFTRVNDTKVNGDFIKEIFLNMYGQGLIYLVIFLISLVFILLKKDETPKLLFIYFTLVMTVIFYNPVSGAFFANLISTAVYWRVFWLLPVGLSISYFLVMLLFSFKEKYRVLMFSLLCLLIILPGRWMYSSENGFFMAKNRERINPDALAIGEIVENKGILLAPPEISSSIRQKYTGIELICSREMYVRDFYEYRGNQDESNERIYLMYFTEGAESTVEWIKSETQKHKIDYIAVSKNAKESEKILIDNKFTLVAALEEVNLYSVN